MTSPQYLVLSTLISLGFAACGSQPIDLASADERSDTLAGDADLVRFDIEVVGEGQVGVLEPYVETCNTADGICSFVFERGTRVVFKAEVALAVDHEPIVHCSGRAICALYLDQSLTMVADFESKDWRIEGARPFGFLPGAPWFIIDPFVGGNERDRGVTANSPDSMMIEE